MIVICLCQVLLLYKGLVIHCKKAPQQLRPFHDHMVTCFEDMKTVLERDYGIKVKVSHTSRLTLSITESIEPTYRRLLRIEGF